MPRRRTTITAPLSWSTASVGGLIVLRRLGRGDPRFEVPNEPAAWPAWWAAHDPLDVAAALGRWLALVLLGYLAAVSVLHLAAALAPRGRVRRVARAATPRFLTGLLAGAVVVAGTSSVGASSPGGSGATSSVDGSNPPVMRVIGAPTNAAEESSPSSSSSTTVVVTSDPTSTVPPSTAPPPPPTVAPPPPTTEHLDPAVPALAPATSPTTPPATEWPGEVVVGPGDHLWSIAEQTVTARLGGVPAEATIADYWRRLIDANRDRLIDPADPSLIHPGQRFVLPL